MKIIAEALGADTTDMDKLKEEDLDFLTQSASADACTPGNPREAAIDDYKAMFRKLM